MPRASRIATSCKYSIRVCTLDHISVYLDRASAVIVAAAVVSVRRQAQEKHVRVDCTSSLTFPTPACMSEAATPRAADAPTFQEVEAPVPAALDSLLSPAPSDSEPHNALRDSGADSDAASRDSLVALALDDDNADAGEGAQTLETDLRFSTIPLSARPSSATLSGAGGSDDGDGDSLRGLPPASPTRDRRRTTVHLASARSSTLAGESVRARSASGSSVTSASAGGLPFLLRGLDLQKVPLDGAGSGSARGSRHDLKEEFNRIHERDLQSDKSHAAIDWSGQRLYFALPATHAPVCRLLGRCRVW
jgi:hypothetical protein